MKRLIALAVLASAACAPPAPAPTAPNDAPQRIVSLDYCADQYVLKLADRDQIAALSPDATADFSYMRAAAAGLATVRPMTEDVLIVRPDLVVRAYGGGPGAAAALQRAGVAVAQLDYVDDVDGVRANVRAMARALGHPARGEILVAQMDARLAAVAAAAGQPLALYATPSGVTSGDGTLIQHVLTLAGMRNYVETRGWSPLPLEQIAYRRPDIIAWAAFRAEGADTDLWSAARHPVMRAALAESAVAPLDGAWTACGGWFLIDAIEALAAAAR